MLGCHGDVGNRSVVGNDCGGGYGKSDMVMVKAVIVVVVMVMMMVWCDYHVIM